MFLCGSVVVPRETAHHRDAENAEWVGALGTSEAAQTTDN
jgi:hypothetical protein